MERLYLVDGSGFIFRAYHAVRPLTRPDGTPVNAVYGFTQMLLKLVEESDADHIAVIFDAARKTFRNDIFPNYKAHRPPPPDDLVPQFDLVKEATMAFGLPAIEMPGYEADDIIATYAKMGAEAGASVTIVSSDKDLMQLVGGRVSMFDSMKNRLIRSEEVIERFGVVPEKVVEVQALAGDSVDNVPGVPGIGVKTAALLINEYGDLETLLEHANEIKQKKRRENLIEFSEQARISRKLVQLKQDVPVLNSLSEFARKQIDSDKTIQFLTEQGFKSIISRLNIESQSPQQEQNECFENVDYEIVQDKQTLQDWIEQAYQKGLVSIDTETTSLNPMKAELVGISLSVNPGRACYIPVAHKRLQEPSSLGVVENNSLNQNQDLKQLSKSLVLDMLRPLLEDESLIKIGQNIKYDSLILLRYGVVVSPVDDTMVCSFVLEGGSGKHGLDELADRHLNVKTIKYKSVVGSGQKQVTFDYVPLEQACNYAAEDADLTLRLHRILKPRLLDEKMVTVYETIERPLIPILIQMEKTGIRVDQGLLIKLSSDLAKRLSALEDEIKAIAGEDFNINSPKQLGQILFEKLGLPGAKKTKTGAYQTSAKVLEDLASEGHHLPTQVLEWRQLAKLKSTYTDSLVKEINSETGRVHTSYAMAGAQTGRLSSTNPNLQNIPIRTNEGRKIRQAFVAKPGHKLISFDYSQIELRVLAHMAEIDSLAQAFKGGADIHATTASQVFGVPLNDIDPQIRRQAKAINFGIIYGISAFGLARQLGIDQTDARSYINAYFEKYPGIKDYMERLKSECRKTGMVTTLFGRRIHLPGINDKDHMRRNYAERQAINAPIQGTAADIIKRAMIRVPQALQSHGSEAAMLLQVHDELLFEVPNNEVDEVAKIITEVMERAAGPTVKMCVPLEVEAGIGDNWDEAH